MRVKVVITGRGYDADREPPSELELPPNAGVDEALAALRSAEVNVSPAALVAVSGEHVGTVTAHASRSLVDGDELLIFAPVAGGGWAQTAQPGRRAIVT